MEVIYFPQVMIFMAILLNIGIPSLHFYLFLDLSSHTAQAKYCYDRLLYEDTVRMGALHQF